MLDAVSVCPEIRAKTEDRSLSRMVVHRIEAILHIQFLCLHHCYSGARDIVFGLFVHLCARPSIHALVIIY